MSWKQEPGPDGRTIWRGYDSVFDRHQKKTDRTNMRAVGAAVAAFVSLFFIGPAIGVLGTLVLAFVAPIGVYVLLKTNSGDDWDTREWAMTGDGKTLAYSAPASGYLNAATWQTPLDWIASVEAAPTKQWETGRDYGSYFGTRLTAIPDSEWQTFLVLEDQSRRVIYTANGNREGAVTLAASIRAHVERARAKPAPIAATSTPSASLSGEGFDL